MDQKKIGENFLILIFGRVIPQTTVTKDPVEGNILRVDIATAWKEMSLSGGMSNQVDVKIFIS